MVKLCLCVLFKNIITDLELAAADFSPILISPLALILVFAVCFALAITNEALITNATAAVILVFARI